MMRALFGSLTLAFCALASFAQNAPNPEGELQQGIQLMRSARFLEAIPHLLASRGHVANEYAAEFNLALCYVATRQPAQAIPILDQLRSSHENASVENLLAQAYIGSGEAKAALDAFRRGEALTPNNEKFYLLIADACTENHEYATGLQVVEDGLRHLPKSARLHFQRAMFLSALDEFDEAKPEFAAAARLDPQGEIGYLASAQEDLFAGNINDAVRIAREAVATKKAGYVSLTILGKALLRSGVVVGDPQFTEAQSALEKAVAIRPDYPDAQLALGKLDLLANRWDKAASHLETARQLDPDNPAVYSSLATAYRRLGDRQRSQQMLAVLAEINRQQQDKINSAPGDRKAIPGARADGMAPR